MAGDVRRFGAEVPVFGVGLGFRGLGFRVGWFLAISGRVLVTVMLL